VAFWCNWIWNLCYAIVFSLMVKQFFGNSCFGSWAAVEINNKILYSFCCFGSFVPVWCCCICLWYYIQSRKCANFQIPVTFLAVQTSDSYKWWTLLKGCSYPGKYLISLKPFQPRKLRNCLVVNEFLAIHSWAGMWLSSMR